jgi:hypothetical protein
MEERAVTSGEAPPLAEEAELAVGAEWKEKKLPESERYDEPESPLCMD